MAIVETSARRAARGRGNARRRAAPQRTSAGAKFASSAAASIRDLAWSGQHERAIEACTQALATLVDGSAMPIPTQMELLDLRAESYIATGKLDLAAADAASMRQLADAGKAAALKALA